MAHRRCGLEIEPESERIGAAIATGIGGLSELPGLPITVLCEQRPGPREPVLDPVDPSEHGRRLGLDRSSGRAGR